MRRRSEKRKKKLPGESEARAEPLLSIVTVCLNEQHAERTCKSVVGQTWRNFEWILIDGGSEKKTLDTFAPYRDCMDVFISEPDYGIYDAMSKGAARARGEWICFLNAGDCFYSPDTLEMVFGAGAPEDADLVYGDYALDTGLMVELPDTLDKEFFFMGNICQQAVFCRAALHKKFPFDANFAILADWDFFLRAIGAGARFKKAVAPLVVFSESGVSHTSPETVFQEREKLRGTYFTLEEKANIFRRQIQLLKERK